MQALPVRQITKSQRIRVQSNALKIIQSIVLSSVIWKELTDFIVYGRRSYESQTSFIILKCRNAGFQQVSTDENLDGRNSLCWY